MTFNDYPKMSVATDIVILATENIITDDTRKVPEKGIQVLLTKRTIEPFMGRWSIPGGFVDIDKDIYEAAKNKLYMKTGIDNLYMEQLYTYGAPNRDERGRVVSVAHLALVQKENIDMHDCAWFWVIPERDTSGKVTNICVQSENGMYATQDLAFDHKQILIDAVNRVINKIEYTDVAFNFVPEYFTVKELEMVFQSFLGRKIQGFRRKMGDRIITTKIMKDDGSAHRPAELYKKNENYSNF